MTLKSFFAGVTLLALSAATALAGEHQCAFVGTAAATDSVTRVASAAGLAQQPAAPAQTLIRTAGAECPTGSGNYCSDELPYCCPGVNVDPYCAENVNGCKK